MRKNRGFDRYIIFPIFPGTPLKGGLLKALTTNHHQSLVSFNGRTFICDTTELRARAIIVFATRESEEKKSTKAVLRDLEQSIKCLHSQSKLCASSGLSIKTSLKSFLQKRKQRNNTLLSSP